MINSTLYTDTDITNEFGSFLKPVSIFIEKYDAEALKKNDINILIEGCEPPELNHRWLNPMDIVNNYSKFNLILASNPIILNNCPNSYRFPFGGRMVESLSTDSKKDKVTFLCGHKNYLPGHILRHKILGQQQIISNLTLEFYLNIPRKHDIFRDSKFSIVIENSQNMNYFTEKIVDCMLLKTIPIYWGCPNVNEFFDMRGVLQFNQIEELSDILKNLTGSYYDDNIKSVNENFIRAMNYNDFYLRVSNIIRTYIL